MAVWSEEGILMGRKTGTRGDRVSGETEFQIILWLKSHRNKNQVGTLKKI